MDPILRDKFKDFEQTPSVSVWSKLDRSLRLKRYARFSFKVGIPLVIASLITLSLFDNSKQSNLQTLPKDSSSLQSNQDIYSSQPSAKVDSLLDIAPANHDQSLAGNSSSVSRKSSKNSTINTSTPVEVPSVSVNSSDHKTISNLQASSSPSAEPNSKSEILPAQNNLHSIVEDFSLPVNSENIETPSNSNDFPNILSGGTEIKQICLGEEIALIAPEGKAYKWSNGDISRTIVVKPNDSQDVTVLLTNWSDQQIEMHYRIEILDCSIYIPRAFTPNGDGQNDVFLAQGDGISNFNMKVYSKQGELLFESFEINTGWDGRTISGKQPFDVYVYRISFNDINGQIHLVSGTFTLLP